MPRPRKPVPSVIADLSYNADTSKYVISELGITYYMDLEHTRSLKEYFRGSSYYTELTIRDWFYKLDRLTKKQIFREGIQTAPTDFYPDPCYWDY